MVREEDTELDTDHLDAAGLASLGSVEAVLQPIEEIAAPARTESVIGFGTGLKKFVSRVEASKREGGE